MLKTELENWGKLIIKEAGMKVPSASVKLKNSLSSVMVGNNTLEIMGQDYGKYVDLGTGPQLKENKFFLNMSVSHNQSFYKSIWDWIKIKEKSPTWKNTNPKFSRKKVAFLIMRKIKRDGTPSTLFLTETIMNSYEKLKERLRENYNSEIELFIGKEFKKMSKL